MLVDGAVDTVAMGEESVEALDQTGVTGEQVRHALNYAWGIDSVRRSESDGSWKKPQPG